MKASDLLVKCLEARGVEYVFGLPGEEIEDLLFSLQKSKIKLITCRHEQGAALMAEVYGLSSGKPGVCLATLGPGATNLVTGVASAHLDKAPLIAITGQGGTRRLHKESHQLIDVVGLFRPVVKWGISITDPNSIPEIVDKAFKISQTGRPGPTHIELPEDIAEMEVSADPLKKRSRCLSEPSQLDLSEAIKLLGNAKKVTLIAGSGAVRASNAKKLRAFVDTANVPVTSTFMGRGAIDDRDPKSLFFLGLRRRDFSQIAIDSSDLIITVGYDMVEYSPDMWNRLDKPIIHIDEAPAEVYSSYQPKLELIGDISMTLSRLTENIDQKDIKFSGWYLPIHHATQKDLQSYDLKGGKTLTVPGFLNILRRLLGEKGIILSDIGAHKIWIGRNYPVYESGSAIIPNGLSPMGISLPGGIAAKLAHPAHKVVSMSGDGGFIMNIQELETAVRYQIPVVFVVFNDNNYGLITWKQKLSHNRSFATKIGNPDFAKLGESFGLPSYHPKTKATLERDLRIALASKNPTLLVVDIDAAENVRMIDKITKSAERFAKTYGH